MAGVGLATVGLSQGRNSRRGRSPSPERCRQIAGDIVRSVRAWLGVDKWYDRDAPNFFVMLPRVKSALVNRARSAYLLPGVRGEANKLAPQAVCCPPALHEPRQRRFKGEGMGEG